MASTRSEETKKEERICMYVCMICLPADMDFDSHYWVPFHPGAFSGGLRGSLGKKVL